MSTTQTLLMIVSDLVMAAISQVVGLAIVALISSVPGNELSHIWRNSISDIWFPIGVITGLALSGSYRRARRTATQSIFDDIQTFFFAIGAGGVISIGLALLWHIIFETRQANPTHVLSGVVVAAFLIPLGRVILRRRTLKTHPFRLIIVDAGPNVARFTTKLQIKGGINVVGWVAVDPTDDDSVLGSFDDLPEICRQHQVDQILLGSYADQTGRVNAVLRVVQRDVQLTIVPRSFELISWRSRFAEISGLPLIDAMPPHLSRWDRLIKRAFDIVVSLIAIAITSPIMVIVAILVATTSPGGVLFRQDRLGRGGQPFRIYKFRSMTAAPTNQTETVADVGDHVPLHERRGKAAEAHRVTAVGRVIRKTSIDELPQLFNVLQGTMSIVGPRPFIPSESEALEGWQARRYEVRPGITGLWQVSGRNELSAGDLVELDYLYVESWSMLWDFKIILETPRTMLRGVGAY